MSTIASLYSTSLVGGALQVASRDGNTAFPSVRQSCRRLRELRPLLAATSFVLVPVLVSGHFLLSPKAIRASPPPGSSPPPLGMMGRTLSTAAFKLGQRVPGEFAIYSKWLPPPRWGGARTGSPPGTCLPPCLWKIYGCLRRLWYLNTTNDAGALSRSRLEWAKPLKVLKWKTQFQNGCVFFFPPSLFVIRTKTVLVKY